MYNLGLGAPENFTISRVDSFSIDFTWLPPSEEYGPFNNYLIRLRFDNRPENVTRMIDPMERIFKLQGLNPYQLVEASLSVVYPIAEGPSVTLTARTLQHG